MCFPIGFHSTNVAGILKSSPRLVRWLSPIAPRLYRENHIVLTLSFPLLTAHLPQPQRFMVVSFVLFILLVANVARVGHAYTRISPSDSERNQPIRFSRLSSSTTLPTSIRSIQLATFASINAERDTTPSGIRFSRVPGTRLHGAVKSYGRNSNDVGKTTLMATMTLIAVAATILTQQMTIAVLSMSALLVCTASVTGTLSIGQQIDRLVKRTVHAIVQHPSKSNSNHHDHDDKLSRLLEEDDYDHNHHQNEDHISLDPSSDPSTEVPSVPRKLPFIQFGAPSLIMEQEHGKHTRPASSNGKRPGGSMVLTNITSRAGTD